MTEDISNNLYRDGSYLIHGTFSTPQGMKALNFLESLFLPAHFDPNNPRDRALYQQGQANVIFEIKDMMEKINTGQYERK